MVRAQFLSGLVWLSAATTGVVAKPVATPHMSAQTTVLKPYVPDHIDGTDVSLLAPASTSDAYYSGVSGASAVTVAKLSIGMKHKSVNLDHSSHISTVSCGVDHKSLNINFGTAQAFSTAQSSWKASKNLIFITSAPGCADDSQAAYFHATGLSFSQATLTVAAVGTAGDVKDYYSEFTVNIGSVDNSTALQTRDSTYSKSLTVPMSISPASNKLSSSPWGKQLPLYSSGSSTTGADFYCVDCGIKGSLSLTAAVSASLLKGLTDAYVSLNGNFHAGMALGVNARSSFSKSYSNTVANAPIGGVSIPKLLSIGPSLSLNVAADFNVASSGQLLAGGALDWPSIQAKLDFVNKGSTSVSGFKPNFNAQFQASGSATLTGHLGLPVSLAVGIDILNGHWKKSISLKDTPNLTLTSSFTGSVSKQNSLNRRDTCYGFPWTLGMSNVVDFTYGTSSSTLYSVNLPALACGCVGIAKPTTATTATSTNSPPRTSTGAATGPATTPAQIAPPAGNPATVTVTLPTPHASTVTVSVPASPALTETVTASGPPASTVTVTATPSGASGAATVTVTITDIGSGSAVLSTITSTTTATVTINPTTSLTTITTSFTASQSGTTQTMSAIARPSIGVSNSGGGWATCNNATGQWTESYGPQQAAMQVNAQGTCVDTPLNSWAMCAQKCAADNLFWGTGCTGVFWQQETLTCEFWATRIASGDASGAGYYDVLDVAGDVFA
ncbi:hypothetical protein K461DRAFT_325051 [Myriangium duriaei CBS 260.36]|uniref:Apple domain-containing protein n=1 Tax=Myriangium duriaei CBS 260.36 TaxID=1168546 RepID=A0A9P4IR26_9PEZI|nr:hypothetical protein K461DRAFT_325051 [Myriangium duriaei CBS 260.36]